MRVFVSGGWQPEKVKRLSGKAYELGKLLAKKGVDLTCGPGTGVARFVIDGYRSEKKRGRIFFYLPKLTEMKRVGEEMEDGADEIVETNADYPTRNLIQVKESDMVIGIGGSTGTLTEVIAAVMDYHIPVAMFDDGSEAVEASKMLTKLKGKVRYCRSISSIVAEIPNKPPYKN